MIKVVKEAMTSEEEFQKSVAFNDKYFPRVPEGAKLVRHRKRDFWYDESQAILHYVFKEPDEVEYLGKANAPWRSMDGVGLSRDNWKKSKREYLDQYSDDLDEEGAYLSADLEKEFGTKK